MTQVDELAKDTGRIRDRAESAGNCRLFKQGRHCSWIKWDDGSSVGWVVSRLSSHSILVSPRKRRRIERGKRGGWEKSILVRHKLQQVISINVWGSLVCCSSNARHSPSPASPAYGWSPTPAAAASGKKIAHEQHKYGCQGFFRGKKLKSFTLKFSSCLSKSSHHPLREHGATNAAVEYSSLAVSLRYYLEILNVLN